MATFVFLHAHPDDEAIGSGGTIAALAAAGHRAVVLLATRGERGIVPAELAEADGLGELRAAEAHRSAELLGAARLAFLGYRDSGEQPGDPAPGSFAAADPDEAAARVVQLLREEAADALIIYDEHGITGHPDHVQVHEVGMRAAAGLPGLRVYQGTLSESQLAVFVANVAIFLAGAGAGAPSAAGGGPTLYASPDASVTTRVDARPWSARKRAAMAAHASQIGPDSFFLSLSEEDFMEVFGTESYLARSTPDGAPGPLEAALNGSGALR
ncbi:MAG TPA: PIG-L family deacetylase [Sporichthyaceae bacterium]|nr:PIG-L family deacetylase [Sporichthyaceae bacterium]